MPFQISLAAARVNANMTQEDVAKELKVGKQTVGNWEKGRTEPSVSQMMTLCNLCRVPLGCIFLPRNPT